MRAIILLLMLLILVIAVPRYAIGDKTVYYYAGSVALNSNATFQQCMKNYLDTGKVTGSLMAARLARWCLANLEKLERLENERRSTEKNLSNYKNEKRCFADMLAFDLFYRLDNKICK